jgi:hypothetical protein
MFTSRTLIENYLGQEGVDLLTDDLGSASVEINRAVTEAQDLILSYLLERYTEEELAKSSWVERRATEIAAFFLFHRRGQEPPAGLSLTFNRIQEEFDRIVNSEKMIVPGANPRENNAPSCTNYVVDDLHIENRLRVNPNSSTSQGYPGQPEYRDTQFL